MKYSKSYYVFSAITVFEKKKSLLFHLFIRQEKLIKVEDLFIIFHTHTHTHTYIYIYIIF